MSDAVTDTHSLIWYLQNSPRLSFKASELFEACTSGEINIYVPTICLIEIIYLQEKGRIPSDMKQKFDLEIIEHSNLLIADLTMGVAESLSRVPRSVVPDMPDRIITATALNLGLPLISRDGKIRLSDIVTIW